MTDRFGRDHDHDGARADLVGSSSSGMSGSVVDDVLHGDGDVDLQVFCVRHVSCASRDGGGGHFCCLSQLRGSHLRGSHLRGGGASWKDSDAGMLTWRKIRLSESVTVFWVCLYACLLVCLLVYLFACLLACLFACLFVCLFACLLVILL